MESLPLLVTRAQVGDDVAFGELVQRFQDMAYAYAYAILGDFQLAEDAAQEAFIEAYRCMPNLQVPQAFPAWLKRIVLKHCDRHLRRKQVQTAPLMAADTVPARESGPDEILERRDTQTQVLSAIRALSEKQREVTTLYYINGYSQKEIAAFLEVPPSTVKSRLHTSRKRLKERLFTMVRDTLHSNALPESFAEETLAQAVTQATALNKAHRFGEAEGLLRDVLVKIPDDAVALQVAALRELNRTLMWGQYEDELFDERYNELVANGRALLAAGCDDEKVYRELARTYMYIPRMSDAAEHIETWIACKGPNLERVGMLAWVKSCLVEYDEALALWKRQLSLVEDTDADAVLDFVPYACRTLVDAFAAAGQMMRAAQVAQEAWALCHERGDIPFRDARSDVDWLCIFHQAGLNVEDVAQALLHKLSSRSDAESQGLALCVHTWIETPEDALTPWLAWVRARADAGEWKVLREMTPQVFRGFSTMHNPVAQRNFAEAMLSALADVQDKGADSVRWTCRNNRFDVWSYIRAGELSLAETIARQAVEEHGVEFGGWMLLVVAILRGEPSPPKLVQLVKEQGPEGPHLYGLYGWALIAREAAARGDTAAAFDALRRTLGYWTNPPLGSYQALWENDPYWDDLRDHPQTRRIFDEKRQRIGPIYGSLWYFPGW